MFRYKTPPYAHQEEALRRSYDKKNYAYFMEMGCGKSKVLIDNIVWLYDIGHIDTAIIIAPKGVYRNWELSEIPAHMPDHVDYRVDVWKPSPNKAEKEKLMEGATEERKRLRILLINVEAFGSTTKKLSLYLASYIDNCKFMLAVDESTTIKNPKAKRTKNIIQFGKQAGYKRILTGSPVTKSPMDLFSQCEFMDKSLLNHDSYWSFQGRYAVTRTQKMGKHSFQMIVGYRNLEELSEKLDKFSFRVTKEQALDLPDKIYTTRGVSLTDEQLEYYVSLKNVAVALLEGGDLVSAPAVMTQLLRLQQVLCGHVMTDDGELVEIPSRRIDALLDTIEEMQGKIIMWSRFRYDIKKIAKVLKDKFGEGSAVTFFGDTTDNERQNAIESFERGEARFFVANPQTAGRGLTLNAATNVIYYSNDFNLETRMQSEDRCHRIGQHNKVLYVDLVCRGTVDVHIVKTLQGKIKISAATLGEKVKEWLRIPTK